MDWIDRELGEAFSRRPGRGGDCLLELRRLFSHPHLNLAVGRFQRLLPRLERTHFLLGYRIRQWLSLNFELHLSDPLDRVPSALYPISSEKRSLAAAKRHFFETAETLIAFNDIRVQVVPKISERV